MISIRNLSFKYNNTQFHALKSINLDIQKGEFILVTGNSGCGKTSLIRAMNGLIPHFYGGKGEGSIEINGLNPFKDGPRKLSKIVGTVFQNSENQLFMKNVDSEIAFGMENLGITHKQMEQHIHQIAEELGLQHLLDREVENLSGGEKQKVAFASILAMGPDVLLLDEPTSELDPLAAKEMMEILSALNKRSEKTIIITEHRLERVLNYVNRLIFMKEGKIIADSNPKHIFSYEKYSQAFSPPIVQLFQELRVFYPEIEIPLSILEAKMSLDKISRLGKTINSKKPINRDVINTNPLLELKEIWFRYPKSEDWILQNVSMSIFPNDFVAVIGKNGSGKTTLMKHMNGLLRPHKGFITYQGKDTRKQTIAELSRNVGYIFQNPSIQFYQDTLFDEFSFVLKNYGYKEEKQNELIEKLLKQFNLNQYKNHYGRFLSIGEQQRAALATVLLLQPSVLVLDEPTHGMDIEQKTEFMEYLTQYRMKGNAVVLVTHDIETVAKYAKRVIILSNGKILDEGLTHSVLPNHEPFIPQINLLVKHHKAFPNWILTPKEFLEVLNK